MEFFWSLSRARVRAKGREPSWTFRILHEGLKVEMIKPRASAVLPSSGHEGGTVFYDWEANVRQS